MKTAIEKTLQVLEWPEWIKTLSDLAQSPMGKNLLEALSPEMWSPQEAEKNAEAALELVTFHSKQRGLPLTDLKDLSSLYRRMLRSGAISVEDFTDLVNNQKGVLSLKATLLGSQLSVLQGIFVRLEPLKDWCDVHFRLLDQSGQIADCASEDLRALRMLTRNLRLKIDEKLKDFMSDPHFSDVFQDDYVTLRDGRYVLPVKNSYKGRMPGIIHDLSKTEATLFIEPQIVVDLNNQLKVAEREIEIEIERILAEIVTRSQHILPDMEENQKLLARGDYLQSIARVVARWDRYSIAKISDDSRDLLSEGQGEGHSKTHSKTHSEIHNEIVFEELSHPLLALQTKVVANTLSWRETLILSGPNTGGKTVLLKSVGLALLFARTGIPICASYAKVPSGLKNIFAEMGDDQNLFEKLSTFSAHVASLSLILKEAQAGDLVLIDEIATGTAPEEGQALARALLESFLERGVKTFVTTHYGALKVMALANERCRVASMAYDTQKRMPLYKIIMDVPGESSALDAAARLGIPESVLGRAKELLGDDSEDLALALKNLEKSRKHFEDKLLEIEVQKKTLRQKESEVQHLKELANEKLRDLSREEAKELLKEFRSLREELSAKLLVLNHKTDSTQIFEEISQESQKLKDLIREDIPSLMPKRGINQVDLKKGVVVEVSGLGIGIIEEDFVLPATTSTKAYLVVKVGELKTRVSLDRIFDVSPEEKLRYVQGRRSWLGVEKRKTSPSLVEIKSQAGSVVCDVRGRNWDEARRKIDIALNQVTNGEASSVTVIHGHGKEILKDRIRTYLEKERCELKFRTGSWPGEGGDGVTVVEAE